MALLDQQEQARAQAWERVRAADPKVAERLEAKLDSWSSVARDREKARSEAVRVFWLLRNWVLRAGELTGHGDDLFFLSTEEILSLLIGTDEASVLEPVAVRRATHDRYARLPPYPTYLRGHFDPFAWAGSADRRNDYFDATEPVSGAPVSETIKGFAGASGVVEGVARMLTSAGQGEQLRPGEILVTTVTNIGWTPLFPRAGAVVTDVGAPLSHAAIVARELGIPAVVGCGNATMRVHSGDRIRVDGSRGTVELLRE